MVSAKIWRVQVHIPVKTYDIDFSGTVGNVAFVRWLEDLRMDLGREFFPVERMLADGLIPTVARTVVAYKAPVRLGDDVRGSAWVSRLGAARWTVEADLWNGRTLAASASQECCFISAATGRIAKLPRWVREACVPLVTVDCLAEPRFNG